jgi:hypothetical protein
MRIRTPSMSHASRRSRAAAHSDLSLPRWAFVAWLVRRAQLRAGPRRPIVLVSEPDIEANRRARLLRELVPQDA